MGSPLTAPTIFETAVDVVIRGEGTTPGTDDIVGETSAWVAAYSGTGFVSTFGTGVIDPGRELTGNVNRSGLAYYVQDIRPQNTTGPQPWQYGIRFMAYDLKTKTMSHYSYPAVIIPQPTGFPPYNDYRAPGVAVNPHNNDVFVVYGFGANADDPDEWTACTKLYYRKSTDQGVTWGTQTELWSETSPDLVTGGWFQPAQISFSPTGNRGFVLINVWDQSSTQYVYRSRKWNGSSFDAAQSISVSITPVNSEDGYHAIACGNNDALAVFYYGVVAGHNQFKLYTHTYSGSWSLFDTVDTIGDLARMFILRYDSTRDIYFMTWVESSGGVWLYAIKTTGATTGILHTVEVSLDSDIDEIDFGITPSGDALQMEVDIDGKIFIAVTAGGTNVRTGLITYTWDETVGFTKVESDVAGWYAPALAYYFEGVDPHPGNPYNTTALYLYDGDLHMLWTAPHTEAATGQDNFADIWEIVATSIAAAEPAEEEGAAVPEGEGGYFWLQSAEDTQDGITDTAGSDPTLTPISATATLHPIYAGDTTRIKRWLLFLLRYSVWGVSDLTLTWWGDNRPTSTRTVSLNPGNLPTPFSGPSEGGEFLSTPKDIFVQSPVNVRTGGVGLNLKIESSRGRYSLRGFVLKFQPTKRHAMAPRILPYSTPQDANKA